MSKVAVDLFFCSVMYIREGQIIERIKCNTGPSFCTSVVDWMEEDRLHERAGIYATRMIDPVMTF